MVRLSLWTNMPTHHQSAFFAALRAAGVALSVQYYGTVSAQRVQQGWEAVAELPFGERFVTPAIGELLAIADWKDYVHIVPGYGSAFLRRLARTLSRSGVPWMHWSEPAQPGLRWLLGYPRKAWYAREVNRGALAALAIGDLACSDFRRWGIDPRKIRLLPYAGSLPPRSQALDGTVTGFAGKAGPLFMHVGALSRRKGVDVLVRAFAEVATSCPAARLALIGRDETHGGCRKLVTRMGLQDRVLLHGPVPFRELGGVLAAGDVLVLASRFDGWGMVLAEAAGYGKALIGSHTCGAAGHLIHEGRNGFRVHAGDVRDLAEKMLRYAAQRGLAAEHGRASIDVYREFTPERNAQRLIEIVEEVRATMRGRPHGAGMSSRNLPAM